MSRLDDLRRMREERAEAKAKPKLGADTERKPAPLVEPKRVTKVSDVTKVVTKVSDVTKVKMGRPRLGVEPMTGAERMRRYRQRRPEA